MSTYIGILDDDTEIRSYQLDNIKNTPELKYLFKIDTGHQNVFAPIDKHGNVCTVTIGKFDLIHIGESGGRSRTVTIKDNTTGKKYQIEHFMLGFDYISEE